MSYASTYRQLQPLLVACSLAAAVVAPGAYAQTAAVPVSAPAPASNLGPGVIAKVNNVAITDAQLQRAIQQSGLPDSPNLRAALKNQLVSRELFRQDAEKTHAYDNRPEVKQAMQEAKDATITQLYLRDVIKPAPVTEEQVRAQFNNIVASLGDKEYKSRLIQVGDAATAADVLTKLKAGADFAQLAQQVSLAQNKVRGGDLDWISFKTPAQEGHTQNLPLPIAQALTALPAGGVTLTPVNWNNAYFILKLEQVRPTVVPKYDDVKAVLRQQQEAAALEKATIAVVSNLVKQAKIKQ
ncbi:parvulin-like peptidyl-prolyl isomerase [Collimonas sp. PA-H2]|uniref:peptidyl-prolyl cis-trans isomerase n=1 Tax=Collimonas sp. PA-H2 TaxID=1881062 RepID=UPI000BF44A3C|nr:peptidyl-prolyl cis-trans isomerase [Collimonas sp. PA-H2]PFH10114.1 parvulin-like peptidyl-prolyl isomerase [Collimonas sp. PA-H2]